MKLNLNQYCFFMVQQSMKNAFMPFIGKEYKPFIIPKINITLPNPIEFIKLDVTLENKGINNYGTKI